MKDKVHDRLAELLYRVLALLSLPILVGPDYPTALLLPVLHSTRRPGGRVTPAP